MYELGLIAYVNVRTKSYVNSYGYYPVIKCVRMDVASSLRFTECKTN